MKTVQTTLQIGLWAAGHDVEHSLFVCDEVLAWLSEGQRGANDLHPSDATATSSSLAAVKSRGSSSSS